MAVTGRQVFKIDALHLYSIFCEANLATVANSHL
jgi:hypothetical protein